MKIVFSDKFGNELERILNFIAQDSLNKATEFNDALYGKIQKFEVDIKNGKKSGSFLKPFFAAKYCLK